MDIIAGLLIILILVVHSIPPRGGLYLHQLERM